MNNKSTVISLRLRFDELTILDAMRDSAGLGHMSRTEFVRRMILVEHNRRKGLPTPSVASYDSTARNGRPKKEKGIKPMMASFDNEAYLKVGEA